MALHRNCHYALYICILEGSCLHYIFVEALMKLLKQLLEKDESDCVEFILDYRGLDITDIAKTFQEEVSVKSESQAFGSLFDWALDNDKKKCAVLFWKRSENLLSSALHASRRLHKDASEKTNPLSKNNLEKHGLIFKERAIGVLDCCFERDIEKTMKLLQAQSVKKDEDKDHISMAQKSNNKQILGRPAYREYINRIWRGKIRPYTEGSKDGPWLRIIRSPRSKFVWSLVMYLIFLGIFANVIVAELRPRWSYWELVLALWWLSLCIEEMRQCVDVNEKSMKDRVRKHFTGSYWNIWDLICLLLYLLGEGTMVVAHIYPTNEDIYDAGRVILVIDWMLFSLRILQYLSITNFLGPVLEMMKKMILDLLPFLVIMLVFITTQALSVQALLYPATVLTGDRLIDSFKISFWNVFGEYFFDDIEATENRGDCSIDSCPDRVGSYAVPFLMAIYVVLMNVLVLNIIIARFNYTFEGVHAAAKWVSAWHQTKITLECYKKWAPPPFTLFYPLYLVFSALYRCCCKRKKEFENLATEDIGGEQIELTNMAIQKEPELSAWERSLAEYYLANAETPVPLGTTTREDIESEVFETLHTLREELSSVSSSVKNLKKTLRRYEKDE